MSPSRVRKHWRLSPATLPLSGRPAPQSSRCSSLTSIAGLLRRELPSCGRPLVEIRMDLKQWPPCSYSPLPPGVAGNPRCDADRLIYEALGRGFCSEYWGVIHVTWRLGPVWSCANTLKAPKDSSAWRPSRYLVFRATLPSLHMNTHGRPQLQTLGGRERRFKTLT